MTVMIFILGLVVFVGFLGLFIALLKRTSPESALLEQVVQRPRRDEGIGTGSQFFRSAVSVDRLAKPFAVFRSLLGGQPAPDIVRRLALAGFRKPAHIDILLGARLAVPAILAFSVALVVKDNVFLFMILAIVVGFFLPEMWLSETIKKRRAKIGLSLPDGLDLLSICMEAGLSLDQGIVRVGQELKTSHPALSEELLQLNFEQRAGVPRMESWKSLADRVDLESVRSFVAMLLQTERFGTPVSKSLVSFSDALRIQRRQKAEELAAKSSIKLILPLAFFVFPGTFIVTVGPAIILMIRNIGTLLE